ncbi:MAG: biopolymer transporter ExbD [Phycisphaerales bacterium]|nr:biopolymer transporter ExbD [Phycisphaerales bacterium]
MRINQDQKHRRLTGRLEITSLIDVIFLLLIFFLVSARQQPPESELAPALQAERVSGGRSADLQPQIVEVALIENQPGFRIGQNVVRDRDALSTILSDLPREDGVFVRASNLVTTEWAMAALQACADAGFDKVTYVPAE